MKQLIVVADDLGLTKSINEGIAKAYREGIVTALSLLPTGEAFEDAVNFVKESGLEEIGAHLALTETRPLTSPNKIPSLIRKDGRFLKNHNQFFLKFFLKLIGPEEVHIELRSQLDALKKVGVNITHLSGHEHIHMIPEVLKIFVSLAKEYGIHIIRCPRKEAVARFKIGKIYRYLILEYFDKGTNEILGNSDLKRPDSFLGFLDSGRLNEEILLDMLKSLTDGVTELISHPGFLSPEVLDRYRFHINCEEELFALTSPRLKRLIESEGIRLTTYQEFLSF